MRAAFLRSGIRGGMRFVYLALLEHADNETCEIPDRFQPYGQHSEAWWGVSRRTVQRSLPHLYDHGWLSILPWSERPRKNPVKQARTEQRRGRPRNWYGLCEGRPCPDGCPHRGGPDKSARGANESARDVDIATGEVIEPQATPVFKRQDDALITPIKAPNSDELSATHAEFQQVTPQIAMKGISEGKGMRGGVVLPGPYTGPRPLPDWEPGANGAFMNPRNR